MPAKGWKTLNVRVQVWERLKEFMEKEGLVSPNDAVRLLLERYSLLNVSHVNKQEAREGREGSKPTEVKEDRSRALVEWFGGSP